MRFTLPYVVLLAGLLAGCGGASAVKPVEVLDENSGMTLGLLKEPIELLPSGRNPVQVLGKRTTFAYLGPVEWNRSGVFSYGLWIHVAPGNDRQVGDIHADGALTVLLDEGPLVLTPIEPPQPAARDPYRQAVSWGQTAYFDLNVETLRRMAASSKLELDLRGTDGKALSFLPTVDTRAVLTEYVKSRGVTAD
jgi:hypothetical protein